MSAPEAVFLYDNTVCLIEAKSPVVIEWLEEALPERRQSHVHWWLNDAEVEPMRAEMQAAGFEVTALTLSSVC